ncbi:hypothetical protein [Pseudomonas sp. Marseille-P9899]|uniref:hypothetical protein n=1 Tax=Pseudomonas sp. Marseille-P9899 TaxID=2730401 RepID=UPI00158BEEEF|nr:hypothetical protein [Pseudomonas sp. Marseille-P9899]
MLFTFYGGAEMGAGKAPVSGFAGPERRRRCVWARADGRHDGGGAVLLRLSGAGQGVKNKKRRGGSVSSKTLHYFYFMNIYRDFLYFFGDIPALTPDCRF